MIQSPSKTIFIGGDGGYDTHFADIAQRFPIIDAAFLENGQYSHNWRFIHLMPDDLIKAIKDLNPKKAFALHNSKYALSQHDWDAPLNFIAQAAQAGTIKALTPMLGEVVNLDQEYYPLPKWWVN